MGKNCIKLICSFFLFFIEIYGNNSEFCYISTSENGPWNWSKFSSKCLGLNQSPINIIDKDVIHKNDVLKFTNFNKDPLLVTFKNIGHTIQLKFNWKREKPTLTGGPLNQDVYEFVQLHFHFGDNKTWGSEHHLNGNCYPLEMHLVFCNTKYTNFVGSLKNNDGLAVIGRFFEVVPDRKPSYDCIKYFNYVPNVTQSYSVKHPKFTLQQLLTSVSWDFYSYQGSLTTPPCLEIVTWILFKDPIPISSKELKKFWTLNGNNGFMRNNFRPVQDLNGRNVFLYKNVLFQ